MVKKRSDLTDKLNGTVKPKGWADVIASGQIEEKEEDNKEVAFMKKTYLLRPTMVEDIAALAKQERVQVNELVRFLLLHAIEDLKNGTLTIQSQTEVRRIVT